MNDIEQILGSCMGKVGEQMRRFLDDTDAEDDLQIFLRGHLYIEHEIEKLLRNELVDPDSILTDRFMFANKVKLAIALGLIPKDMLTTYNKLNSIRNKYAHELKFQIKDKHLSDLVSTFNEEIKKDYTRWNNSYKDGTPLQLRLALIAVWGYSSKRVYTRELEKYSKEMRLFENLEDLFGESPELREEKTKLLDKVIVKLHEISED
ncbi:hypothetical protein [Bacillus wiedmannii]|uniref:DUF4145 domain-containing protein n=1 Tax=Bacillus wiedmannii TaxID=1890302 RepID=A0A2B5I3X0_9BACI|nr:hypothetical protein [Bacillus wiedmannii]PFZ19541.1 hypothetical protein COL66_29295 [Bacillus wiedmannii]